MAEYKMIIVTCTVSAEDYCLGTEASSARAGMDLTDRQ